MSTLSIPSTMRAFMLEEYNTEGLYTLHTSAPVPQIQHETDLLIRVDAASYCHTDAVVASGNLALRAPLPHVGCHEYAGTVVAIGTQTQGFKPGDRVAVPGRGNRVCGECLECRHPSGGPLADEPGFSVYCPYAGAGLGVDRPGGFREYAIVDSRQVARIPDGMSAVEVAPLMCAGLTVYTALRACGLSPGQRVGIMGCGGGLGHLGLQFATKMGLKTTGVDVASRALRLARQLETGATIVDASMETAADVKQKMGQEDSRGHPSEFGLDAVLILPDTQKAFDYGVELVRDGGVVVVLSFPPEGFHVAATDLVFRRIRMIGSLIGSNKAMREMFDFCVEKGVKAHVKTYPFVKLNELVKDYHSGLPGKLVVDMSLEDE